MTIKSAVINLENDHITFFEAFGKVLEFDMNTETLPKWMNDRFNEMKFEHQIGNYISFR